MVHPIHNDASDHVDSHPYHLALCSGFHGYNLKCKSHTKAIYVQHEF